MIRVSLYFPGSSLHELGDDLQPQAVRFAQEVPEVGTRAVVRMDVVVVGDVVSIVTQRRRVERQQPDRVDTQVADVIELLRESLEVADAVVVRVEVGLDVELVDDDVLVPERVLGGRLLDFFRFRELSRCDRDVHPTK
jgi:hypothetical protein